MKYLGTRTHSRDLVVVSDLENKEQRIRYAPITTELQDDDYLVQFDKSALVVKKTFWSEIKSKIETFIRAAFKTTPLPLDSGGTGATTAAAARSNLGITPANIGALPTAAGAVGTNNLADGAVTGQKIADGAVRTSQIAYGSVTTDKLASNARYGGIVSVTAGRDFGSGWNNHVIVTTSSTSSRVEIAIRQGYEATTPVGFKFRIVARTPTVLWIAGYDSVSATFVSSGERKEYTNVNNRTFSIPANRYMDVQKIAENTWVLTGNYADPIISGGTAAPSGGNNGDIYIQYSAASSASAVSKADVIGAADAADEAESPVSEADVIGTMEEVD